MHENPNFRVVISKGNDWAADPGNSYSRDVTSLLTIPHTPPRLLRPQDALGFGAKPLLRFAQFTILFALQKKREEFPLSFL